MGKLNKKTAQKLGLSPLKVTSKPVVNFQGGDALMYGKKSRLLLLAVNTFAGEDTFYAAKAERDAEMKQLALLVAGKDPDWMKRFLPWLRNTANIRTSAITMAVDVAYLWAKAGYPGGRQLVNSVLVRADEPGEAVACFMSTYGRSMPKPIKRGIADAASRLYNEFTLLKYDSDSAAVQFGDVLELTHPSPAPFTSQGHLFKYAIDVRHNRHLSGFPALPMVSANKNLRKAWSEGRTNIAGLNPEALKAAGMTWEDVLSALGSKVDKKQLWEALIPGMGYMAVLRNLRNFEQAGVNKAMIKFVQDKLADPAEVAKSRQLPMRFLSAHRSVVSDTFRYALEQALQESLNNVPSLPGRTLILVDTSGSMNSNMSGKSELKRWDAAVIFGLALAQRCDDAQVVSFSSGYATSGTKVFPAVKGESLLKGIDRWKRDGFFIGGGTDTARAVDRHFGGQRRIVILTDEESFSGNVYANVPESVIKIDINLAGYGHSHAGKETKNLIKLAGLSDAMFGLIPTLESGLDESWPF